MDTVNLLLIEYLKMTLVHIYAQQKTQLAQSKLLVLCMSKVCINNSSCDHCHSFMQMSSYYLVPCLRLSGKNRNRLKFTFQNVLKPWKNVSTQGILFWLCYLFAITWNFRASGLQRGLPSYPNWALGWQCYVELWSQRRSTSNHPVEQKRSGCSDQQQDPTA